jgi:plastocyanin
VTVRLAALALVMATLVGVAGCSIWGPEGGPGGAGIAVGSSPSEVPVVATAGSDGVQRIEVTTGDDLRFTPSLVQAHTGVIEFVFHNAGTTAHDIAVEPGTTATGNLNGGDTRTVRVTVDKPGRYPFPCLYHVSSGMTGTLEVI